MKVGTQTKKNLYKTAFFYEILILKLCCGSKGLIMFLIHLIIIFLFYTLLRISFAEKKKWIKFLLHFTFIQHAETTLFFKACLFLPLAGG
jgi:hypothetical protein